jgi:nucleotide-binding universal stress UspA family protein
LSGIRRIIVGTSGSPGSLPALRSARSLAQRDGALLVAVHAWVPPGGEFAYRGRPAHLRKLWADAARKRLHEALDLAWGGIPAGLAVEPLVVCGEPGPALVNLASSAGDLLVVGAGRRSRLARMLRGQVSRYCLARAHCPVIAVPPSALSRRLARRLRAWNGDLIVEQPI